MKGQIDLHVHTTASDGGYSPMEIVKKAKDENLAALGITDHDTVGGLGEAIEAGRKFGVEVVPGVEITSYFSFENCDDCGGKKNFTFSDIILTEKTNTCLKFLKIIG